jgi:hypothetical protein
MVEMKIYWFRPLEHNTLHLWEICVLLYVLLAMVWLARRVLGFS